MKRAPRLSFILVLLVLSSSLAFASSPPDKSAVLFIGDGMGPQQIALGRAAGGPLTLDRMPYSGIVITVNIRGEVTDSGAAATALATGYKTQNGMLGMTADERPRETILERCKQAGKSVGIISNDALCGATPAGFAVHINDRDLGGEIARQVAESGAQVMLGYGKEEFLPKAAGGARTDGRDLVAELRRKGYEVVFTRDELAKAKGLRLVGLFGENPPPLAEMVNAALARLSRNDAGFFLVCEQAQVDWKVGEPAGVALDVLALDKAVSSAEDYARARGHTIVVVTSDHESGGLQIDSPEKLSVLRGVRASSPEISGRFSSDRGNIREVMAEDAGVSNLTDTEVNFIKSAQDPSEAIGAVLSQRAGLQWSSGHTRTPVRAFAFGPDAQLFTGQLDNTDIPKRIAEALGFGKFAEAEQ